MKRIMCYCLAISMFHHGSSELDCTEPQLLVKETYCGYDNLTSLAMYTFNKEIRVNIADTFTDEGCNIDFVEPHLNDTFYIECDIAETNCFSNDSEVEDVERDTYYLVCEEVDLVGNDTAITFAYNDTEDSSAETDLFRKETTTDFAVVLTNSTVNSSDVDVFSNESAVMDVSWSTFDVFGIGTTNKESTESEYRNETATYLLKKIKEYSPEFSKVLPILGYLAAALGATGIMGFGIHRLRKLSQSGSYLLPPDAPNPPSFIELA